MNHSEATRYGIVLATFVVAVAVRSALIPVFGPALPYITFYPAIMVSAWYGGLRPGLLATALGGITALLAWPAGGGGSLGLISLLSAALYFTNGTAISWLTELLHRARRQQEAFRSAAVVHEREVQRLLCVEQDAHALADRANRAKDQFLAILSHELRTPLTAIIGWAHVLRTRPVDAEHLDRALETIERSARMQQQLVEDLLDVSRIVAGKLTLEKRELGLGQIVDDGVEAAREAAAAKSLTIAIGRDGSEDIRVLGDPLRLQQVVANLLSNALKFTPPGGHIDIRLERRDARARLSVTDTGEGIAAGDLQRIFGRFEQGAVTIQARRGGLGLGLAITRELVDAHGGSIRAESPGKGRGATLVVELPFVAVRRSSDVLGAGPRLRRDPLSYA